MRRVVLLAFGIALLATGSARPQHPPVFGASADLVMIDLIAADGDGRVIADLRADEIEVSEEGKKQRVEFVRFVSAASLAGAPGATASLPVPAAPVPAAQGPAEPAAGPGFRLVVVVDLLTMPFEAFAHTRDAITKMARSELEPGARLMLITLDRGLHVRQQFTPDLARFVSALQAIPPPVGAGEAALSELVDKVEDTCDGTPGAVQNAIALGRAYVEDARIGMTSSLEGMGALARYLAAVPGRKHVVYYSAGYPMDPAGIAASVVESICGRPDRAGMPSGAPDAQNALRVGAKLDATGLLRALLDEANRAQTSIYTVDARGLMGDATPARSRAPTRLARGGMAQQVTQRNVRAPQEILYSIAEGTGGTASVNTNELARGMRAAAEDARGYYLVAYAPPPGRKEGRFYTIELKTSRPGLSLRYRRGYEWRSDAKRAERALSAALRFPALYAQTGLTLDAWSENDRLNVAAILPTSSLEFRKEGAEYRNEIALYGLLRDHEGRAVGDRYLFSKNVSMKLPEARYAELRSRENIEVPSDVPQPKKGHYQLTVAVLHSGGRLATAILDFDIP